jgi:hypothetical protein
MSDFYRSAAFKKFIEGDMPKIAEALTRISRQLEVLNEREERKAKLDEKLTTARIKSQIKGLHESKGN